MTAKIFTEFDLYDVDGSGHLDLPKFKNMLKHIGIHVDDGVNIEEMMKDFHLSRHVTKKEFIKGLVALSKIIAKTLIAKYNLLIATSALLLWYLLGVIGFWALEDWDADISLYFCMVCFPLCLPLAT